MLTFKQKGDWSDTRTWLQKLKQLKIDHLITRAAKDGLKALSEATPKDTGKTSRSWYYEIKKTSKYFQISWKNSNVVDAGVNKYNVALLIQYGHVTGRGSYVSGVDYINPALTPIFDELSQKLRKEVLNV